MTARFICNRCGHVSTCDDDAVSGMACIDCLQGWASRITAPVGRYAAHRYGIDVPEAADYCQHPSPPPSGPRICPNTADGADRMCSFHRIGGTVAQRRAAAIDALF